MIGPQNTPTIKILDQLDKAAQRSDVHDVGRLAFKPSPGLLVDAAAQSIPAETQVKQPEFSFIDGIQLGCNCARNVTDRGKCRNHQ